MVVLIHTKEYYIGKKIENTLRANKVEVYNFNDEIKLLNFIRYTSLNCIVFADKEISDRCKLSDKSYMLSVFTITGDMSEEHIISTYKQQVEIMDIKNKYTTKEICQTRTNKILNDNLFKPLLNNKKLIKECIDKKQSLFLFGDIGTGKSFVAELVAKEYDNYIIFDAEKDSDIEEVLFGEITQNKTTNGCLDNCSIVVIDNAYALPIKLVKKLASYIVYKKYKKINSNILHTSNCPFIFIPNKDKKDLQNLDVLMKYVFNSLTLEPVTSYSISDIESVLRQIYKWGDIILGKDIRYFLKKYTYPMNLYELQEIAYTIKKTIRTDMEVRPEDLPSWITNKSGNSDIVYTNTLRAIADRERYNLKEVEELVIRGALRKTRYKKEEASRLLGITMTTLRKKIVLYNITMEDILGV